MFLDTLKGLLLRFKFKKTGLGPNVEWSALPGTQTCVVTLCYSPCDNTPTATTEAITTGEYR
jgi:hypothetical protein